MIRRLIAASLALLLTPALSFAQVVRQSATAAPGVVGSVGASVAAPALSPLSAPSALAPSLGVAPRLALPALTPAPALAAAIAPAASKPEAAKPVAAAAALPVAAALKAGVLPAPSIEAPKTASEIAALKLAWQAAHALVEPVPGAPETLAEAPISETPKREYTASPADWRDEILHFMLLDRFARSGKGRPHGDLKDGKSRHGGNLRGVIEKLDYLKKSGITTLLLSPSTRTRPSPTTATRPSTCSRSTRAWARWRTSRSSSPRRTSAI
ncbi:MAG: alpha-amylase family glycosyl hydrolase [Elusimicrobiota bacterium]|nr:MAG: alpha-amylase family glycosyl hydrolase [Elusimicrobiota bacterium]